VVQPRHDRYVTSGEAGGLPNLREAFGSEPWHAAASCRDEEEELLFFYEPNSVKRVQPPRLDSASMLLPLLICATCVVRRECLRAGLEPPTFNHAESDRFPALVRVFGTWGGTHEWDRMQMRRMSTVEAIDELERTLPDRVAARVGRSRWQP